MGAQESNGVSPDPGAVGPVATLESEVTAPPAEKQEPTGGPAAPRSGAARVWGELRTWARSDDAQDGLLVLGVVLLCVFVKVLWLPPVDMYWDAGAKWHFARQWSYANDFSQAHWSHHMARFGVNVAAFLAQKLLGGASSVYYVAPVAFFTLQTVLVYLLSRKLGGRIAGLIGALFLIFSPAFTRSASQLLPDGMSTTAVVAAGYALVKFHEAEGKRRLRWLIGVGLFCCWAYSIKESCVLLLPGVGIAVLLSRRSFKEAFIVAGVVAGYALLETAYFSLFTPYAHRLAVVQEEHGFYPPSQFWDLFDRFRRLEPPSKVMFWAWFVSVFYHAVTRNKRLWLLMILPAGFVFFLTFLVRSIDPLIVWQSAKPRYMAPAMGLMVVGASVMITDVPRRLWLRLRLPRVVANFPGLIYEMRGVLGVLLCAALGYRAYREIALTDRPWRTLQELRRDSSILNDALRRNLPIVEYGVKNPRGLNTTYAIYMSAKLLARQEIAKPGWLPNIQEGVRYDRRRKFFYVVRDASVYNAREIKRYVEAGCGIVVKARGRIRLSTRRKLPAECRAPSASK
jgi:hypothetical protein